LDRWLNESDDHQKIFEEVTNQTKLQNDIDFMEETDVQEKLDNIKQKLEFTAPEPVIDQPAIVRKLTWWAVAAVAILLIGISIYIVVFGNKDSKTGGPAIIAKGMQDVSPGSNKATLTLNNGDLINLEQAKDGDLTKQGNNIIQKQNGELRYSKTTDLQNGMLYNTITTSAWWQLYISIIRRLKIMVECRFVGSFLPVAFIGKERKVIISGEVYFEVAKNAAMPFRVAVKDNDMLVEVLGTHFNINAYTDEDSIAVTLLEGKVKVTTQETVKILSPGDQMLLKDSHAIKNSREVDTNAVTAWKNGKFDFKNADLKSILHEIERWYDVDMVYKCKLPGNKFRWSIPQARNSNLLAILKILEHSGLHFEIEGRKVIVNNK